VQPGKCELNPHGQDDQSHEARDHVTRKPAFSGFSRGSRDEQQDHSQVTRLATAIATRAVYGRPNPEWAAESVMTPVIVPGLAAKRIKGVKDAPAFEGASREVDGDPGTLSIENPIHANTPPPATMKASKQRFSDRPTDRGFAQNSRP
jgi:hypothetical protein